MKNNIFLPKQIKVGFRKRTDTYTKKLAYIIYYDEKGTLRKETSWENWRDKKIDSIDFDNTPISGFVLNKKVGDCNSGWNHRQAYVRIYDPRDFEFEITVENLLYILANTNSIKGKGLEGEFIYGWSGKELVLIPTSSPDYKELTEFNKVVHNKNYVKVKDLVIGATYRGKDNKEYIYMGKFDYYGYQYKTLEDGEYKWYNNYNDIPVKKTHYYHDKKIDYKYLQNNCGERFVFYNKNNELSYRSAFVYHKVISQKFIEIIDNKCVKNYADLFEELQCCYYYSPIDDNHIEIIPYTFEEFKEVLNKTDYCVSFYNKDRIHYIIFYDSDKEQFSMSHNKNEIPIEEMFEKIQPVHFDKYLINGKLYKREY